ncbi:MAG TPA: efflux RND transporter periplasmic adaptor subunit [Bacteroidota bacterium]|nr:efflux RND transporter periplasmic adaptor subunit [Bacteroidota bacterium]
MTIQSFISAMCLGLILSACGPAHTDNQSQEQDAVRVRTLSIQESETRRSVVSSGTLTTENETLLSFKTGGVIKRIFVKDGDVIRKGQLLAALDTVEIEAIVQQAQAGYAKAKRDLNRVKALFADSVATLEQLQNAATGCDIAEHELTIACYNRRYSEIRAVADGTVLKKMATEGQMAGPGMPIVQTNGTGRGHWIIKAGVCDEDWAAIRVGDSAAVCLGAYGDLEMTGSVSGKSTAVDPASGTFTVDIQVNPHSHIPFASGMFGRVTIATRSHARGWNIPHEAVMEGSGKTGYVFVPSENGTRVRKLLITIASMNDNSVCVSEGLDNVPSVIVIGTPYLKENSLISIIQ